MSTALGNAPCSSSNFTVSRWPMQAAKCNGDFRSLRTWNRNQIAHNTSLVSNFHYRYTATARVAGPSPTALIIQPKKTKWRYLLHSNKEQRQHTFHNCSPTECCDAQMPDAESYAAGTKKKALLTTPKLTELTSALFSTRSLAIQYCNSLTALCRAVS